VRMRAFAEDASQLTSMLMHPRPLLSSWIWIWIQPAYPRIDWHRLRYAHVHGLEAMLLSVSLAANSKYIIIYN
jgi:hypothetical protein